jgi:hypothetical protein
MSATRRIRPAQTATVVAAHLLLSGCMQSLPGAPSDVTSGVTIYEHAGFAGGSALLKSDVRDLRDYTGACQHETRAYPYGTTVTFDWNDCISSIKVAPGWRATVYRDDGFSGESLEVTADVPNLQLVRGSCDHDGMNDCITSIRVRQP